MARCRKAAAWLLASLAAAPASAASREWVLARSPGFVVVSDAGEQQARQVAHQFEQVRALFAQVLQARVEPGRLVVIFAVRNEDGLRDVLPAFWESKSGKRPAGIFISGRDKHLVALRLDVGDENPYHVIYHEYTHLLTRLNARWVPLWLSEGLAEFYGTADVDEKEVRWGRVYPPHVLYLREGLPLKLEDLMGADHGSSVYTHASNTPAFYAQSAILTHYLLLGAPERRGQLQQFLKLLAAGTDEPEARRQAFGDLKKMQGEISAYVRRQAFSGLKTPARLDPQGIVVRPLTPAQADALRGDFLARTGRDAEARPLLENAVREDPTLSWAHEGLGTLEAGSDRVKEALGHYVEAFRLGPENYVALFRAGRLRDPAAPADKDAARREQLLRRALIANASFAPALAELSEQLADRPERAEEAIALARKACALDPATATNTVALWNALRKAGREAEAGQVEAELLQVARRDRAALAQVADALESQKRLADAEALLLKARAANPRSVMVAMVVADFFERHDRIPESVAVLRETLAADADSHMLMNTLAYTLADKGGQPKEALELADKALKKEPKSPEYLDTRGWALYRLKRLDEAESALRASLERQDSGVVQAHLADVLRDRGRTPEAIERYGLALAGSDLSDRERADARAKLDALKGATPSPAPQVAASPKP